MPKLIPQEELEAIIGALIDLPGGASADDIGLQLSARDLPIPLTRRTLQRRLATLVERQMVQVTGEGKAVRYRLPAQSIQPVEPVQTEEVFSRRGLEIRDHVRRPIHQRQPVGYNRGFLENYEPNNTFYLSEQLRLKLRREGSGRTRDYEQEAGTYARQIYDRLLIDLSWNSSRLENNTYSLLETERLLQLGENAEGKSIQDAQMILNHKAAIEMLVEDASIIGFNRHTILNLHALLSDNLLSNPASIGRLRQIEIGIGGSTYIPLQVPQLVEEFFELILQKADAITDPFEQAFFVMVHFPYLQPFEDVNKRVSRLAANIPLIRLNLCPLSFIDMPNEDYVAAMLGVYELNQVDLLRDVFQQAYLRSCARYTAVRQSLGDPDPFRLRHRTLLKETVGEVVRGAMDRTQAALSIRRRAEAVPTDERDHFIKISENELEGLHEGNYARYKVRPSEFETWKAGWR